MCAEPMKVPELSAGLSTMAPPGRRKLLCVRRQAAVGSNQQHVLQPLGRRNVERLQFTIADFTLDNRIVRGVDSVNASVEDLHRQEEAALSLMPRQIYEAFVKEYNEKKAESKENKSSPFHDFSDFSFFVRSLYLDIEFRLNNSAY